MRDTLAFCQAQADWLLETTVALSAIESPTTDKAAVDRCATEIERRLRELGGSVSRLEQATAGDHLRAEFGSGPEQVLVLGHFDTVWPLGQLARMPLERRDGRLHGPGVYDMKAGIALGMLAVRAWRESAPSGRRVVLLLTSDEETGSHSSRALIEEEARRSRATLVLEPSLARGGVKTFRKGVGEFEIDVEGVPAHAGIEPGRGASAIHELFTHLAAFRALENAEHGLSVNVGTIEGGTRGNVVAERARAVVDIRVSRIEDGARVERAVRAMTPRDPRTRVSIRGGINRPPLERTEGVGRLYATARGVAAELGFDLPEGGTGGASDGNFTGALGVPTLDGLGAIGAGAHALEEYVEISSLPQRAALVAGLLARA